MKTKYDLIWSVSLTIIGIATLILSGSRIIGIELSDTVVRILGIIDLISLPFLSDTPKSPVTRPFIQFNN